MSSKRDMSKIKIFSDYLQVAIQESRFKNPNQFATASNVSAATISRILNKKLLPDVFTIQKMALALEKKPEELMVAAGYLINNELLETG